MPTVVIGTAGHIDHGKTSLLRALTGIDADRLPEERARGMTIDVGYAHLVFDDGVALDFVDVPGHDRLIGNMLVGAAEIDAAMVVVAADDGPRPQTIEHLQLLDALGIDTGLAVVAKSDVVDGARLEEVVREVGTLLRGTSLASARILAASSATGQGIDAVRAALRTVRDSVAEARDRGTSSGPLRMAIDRVFAVKGRGVVVTGTLRGGVLHRGDALRREPGGDSVRVRAVQVHGNEVDAHDGGRTAVNVGGLPLEAVHRGDVLTAGAGVVTTDRLLVELRQTAEDGTGAARLTTGRSRLRLHLGTDQVDVSVGRVAARPTTFVLRLERAIAASAADRAVVREPASGALLGGVRVLDTRPLRGASRRRMTTDRLERLAAAVDGGTSDAIAATTLALHGAIGSEAPAGATRHILRFAPDVRAALESTAIEAVATHHRDAPSSAGLPLTRARAALLRALRSVVTVERRDADIARTAVAAVLDELVAEGRLARTGEAVRNPAQGAARPPELEAGMRRLEELLAVAAPPPLDKAAAEAGCSPEGLRTLIAEGRITRLDTDLAWATPTFHRLAGIALEWARVAPLTPAAYRDATGTSRRYVLAILEDLDRRGVLQRTPEGHVPGPRAPRAPLAPRVG